MMYVYMYIFEKTVNAILSPSAVLPSVHMTMNTLNLESVISDMLLQAESEN